MLDRYERLNLIARSVTMSNPVNLYDNVYTDFGSEAEVQSDAPLTGRILAKVAG